MLLVSDIQSDRERMVAGLTKRGYPSPEESLDTIVKIDEERRATQVELDGLLSELNAKSKQVGVLMKEGKKDEAEAIKSLTTDLKENSSELRTRLTAHQKELRERLLDIPNVPNDIVPAGVSEEDNKVVKEWGDDPVIPDSAVPHWDLIKKYDIIDFELGNKITGAGFPVYKGKGAKLQRALINYFLAEAEKAGYVEMQPPVVINEDSGYGTGQLPDKEGQMYVINDENLFLIPTAEVPITNLYRDEILQEKQLPIKNVGYTPCFRREAGSWGAHVRGLNRLHQFDKVEIVQITTPENSYEALDEMSSHIQSLIQALGLKYRVLLLCAGDLGFTSAITYDMEVFSAAQQKWLEVSSVSNFETYQSNRLKLRYKDDGNKTQLLHTLNGSALALPRIVAAILENNQTEDGIRIPEVLQPYTGFEIIT